MDAARGARAADWQSAGDCGVRGRTVRLDGAPVGAVVDWALARPAAGGRSPDPLVGLLRCGISCGGGMEVLSSKSGQRRIYRDHCSVARRKGPLACANRLPAPMEATDAAVLDAIEHTLLDPAVVERALAHAEAAIALDRSADQQDHLRRELADVEKASARSTAAIAAGGELTALVAALRTQEDRRTDLERGVSRRSRSRPRSLDLPIVRRQLRAYIDDWRNVLRGQVGQAQQILRRLVKGRLTFTPKDGGFYEFSGVGTVRPVLGRRRYVIWRPRRDSNPCFSLERATSWASGRRGH